MVEANESPRQACVREIKEEIGLDCQIKQLLCVDYINSAENYGEALQFVFYGGVISEEAIKIDNNEISDYQLAPIDQALTLLGPHAQRRIYWSMEMLKTNGTLYLENHEPVCPDLNA